MRLNLNRPDLLQKEAEWYNNKFLAGEYKDLVLRILDVRPVPDAKKSCVRVLYKVQSGFESGSVHFETYYTTEACTWRVRMMACACGFYRTEKNEKGIPIKIVNEDFEMILCKNKTILGESFLQDKYLHIRNEKELKQDEVAPEGAFEEIKDDPLYQEVTGVDDAPPF